ncbi:MAG: zinc metallopeptidase [Christensenellaceae bacterium]
MYYYYLTLLLLVPCILFSAWASHRVKTAYRAYRSVPTRSHMTGYDTATRLLQRGGVYNVQVGMTEGELSDHYDPRRETVNLSRATYGDASVGSVAVAAHEIGHVMQKKEGYLPYRIRTALVPLTNIGSALAMPLVLIGIILDLFSIAGGESIGIYFAYVGIALYGLSTLFMLATLPVELDASRRGKRMLVAEGILAEDEMGGASAVLNAAALTYVAGLLTSLAYFLRFLLVVLSIFGRRSRK